MIDNSKALRIAGGGIMFVAGLLLAVVFRQEASLPEVLLHNIGIAGTVTGCVVAFREIILSPPTKEDLRNGFEEILGKLPIRQIAVLSMKRKGHPEYHKWVFEGGQQRIFFAGHSVLHRIKKDFDEHPNIGPVETCILQELKKTSHMRILFLDPTWELLGSVARSEKQELRHFYSHYRTTLTVCRKIWEKIRDKKLPGSIEIRTCRELVQYAYHRVEHLERNESQMLVGFYFAGRPGMSSPVFTVEDETIQNIFRDHFNNVFEREGNKRLLDYLPNDDIRDFDEEYFDECMKKLGGSDGG